MAFPSTPSEGQTIILSGVTYSYDLANTAWKRVVVAVTDANAAFIQANTAFASSNTNATNISVIQGVDNTQNTNITTATNNAAGASNYANSAFTQANTAFLNAAVVSSYANAAFGVANAAFAKANTGGTGSGIVYTASASKPASANTGDQWYNTTDDTLYEYMNVGTGSNTWIDIVGPTVANATTISVSSGGASVSKSIAINQFLGN